MSVKTRGWSAVILTGASPRLIVEGQACMHPYAIAFLREREEGPATPPAIFLDLKMIGDPGPRELLDWKRISYERVVASPAFDRVVIDGASEAITVHIRRVAASAYAAEARP